MVPPTVSSTEVLDEEVGIFKLTSSLPRPRTVAPTTGFSFKVWLQAEPPGEQPQPSSPRSAQTPEPEEPLGKNQCLGWQAVQAFLPGPPPYPSNGTSSLVCRLLKMLLSEARSPASSSWNHGAWARLRALGSPPGPEADPQ